MTFRLFLACISLIALTLANYANTVIAQATALPLIFDTDIGNDCDDVLAMGVIHALQSRGHCRLIAVTITKDHEQCAAFTDAINTFYHRGEIPIGVCRSGITPQQSRFTGLVTERDNDIDRYPHDLLSGKDAPDAVTVLRKALAAEADGSVVIAQVGFSTNLADLLKSPPDDISPLNGHDLARQKVKLLSVMAGAFAPINGQEHLEYNVTEDVPSAKVLAQQWPTQIVYSGFEIGLAVPFPATSIEQDFNYVPHHPLKQAYILYEPPPHNRPTWDLTSMLYAVFPDRGYFGISAPGTVTVDDRGATKHTPSDSGLHRFLMLTSEQQIRVTEALVQLSSEPPH